MKILILFSICALLAVVQCTPVAKELKKQETVNFAPVEVSENHAGEEGVDLVAAEGHGFGYGRYGGYGHRGYGGYGGYGGWGYGGYRRHGWGGYGSYSNSFSSEYWG
ncbi:keratin-associated protein 19-2-like [Lutzomyia longipalpis]|uniref:keratin-associated protein 19-2-like n=1 Tax=Lutzomyia longipalpis TaxID=7200 RepID=UPI0024840D62|nr:keratin-associated protein 19-2-like [Lutzomyia longipalpis]